MLPGSHALDFYSLGLVVNTPSPLQTVSVPNKSTVLISHHNQEKLATIIPVETLVVLEKSKGREPRFVTP